MDAIPVPSEPAAPVASGSVVPVPTQPTQPEASPAANGHQAVTAAPAQAPGAVPVVPAPAQPATDGQQHTASDGQQHQHLDGQVPQQGQYYHQEQQYDQSTAGGPTYRRPAPDDSLPELRILLHNHDVGPVIGRNGQNVSRMRTESNVYASVLKVRDSRASPDRVMTIRGEPQNIASSLRILAEVLLSAAMEAEAKGIPIPFEPGKTVVRILAQNAVCGSVIGHGGEIVKSIETETEARVKVGSDFLPRSTEKIVSISGTPDAIGKAAHRVVAQLFQKPVRRIPGEQIPYSPDNGGFDRPYDRDRGRFGGPRRDRDFRDYDRRPGGHSDRERDFARDSGAVPPPPAETAPPPPGEAASSSSSSGGDAPPPAFMPVPGTAGYEEGKAGGPLAKQEVSIPSSLTGAVIGRGGGIIRAIQEKSGCTIGISDYDHKNPKERIATITGPASQIPMAVQLIRDAVDDGARVARSPPRDRDRERGDRPYRGGYDRERERERDYDRDRDRYYDRDGRRGPPRYRSRSPPRHPHMAGPPPPHPYAMPPPHGYYPPPAHPSPAMVMPYPSQPVYMQPQPQQAPYGYAYAPAPGAAPGPAPAAGAPAPVAATMPSPYPAYAPAPTAQAPPPQQQAYAYAPYGYAPQ